MDRKDGVLKVSLTSLMGWLIVIGFTIFIYTLDRYETFNGDKVVISKYKLRGENHDKVKQRDNQ